MGTFAATEERGTRATMPGLRWQPALRGRLEAISLASVLTVLEMDRRTGVLTVRRRAQTARVAIRDGQVRDAWFLGGQRCMGIDAVCKMLEWHEGTFELRMVPVEGADRIGLGTTALLMEAARRLDEGDESDDVEIELDLVAG
jgi:two-component system, OmpR family, response regulator